MYQKNINKLLKLPALLTVIISLSALTACSKKTTAAAVAASSGYTLDDVVGKTLTAGCKEADGDGNIISLTISAADAGKHTSTLSYDLYGDPACDESTNYLHIEQVATVETQSNEE